jgi:DnaJ-class molecular chaperone
LVEGSVEIRFEGGSVSKTKCPTCGGDGTIKCDACKGTGSMWIMIRPLGKEEDPDSWEFQDCTKCLGEKGWECPECKGTGKITVVKRKVA